MWKLHRTRIVSICCLWLALLTDTTLAQHTQPKSKRQVTVECRTVWLPVSRFEALNLQLTPSLQAPTTAPQFPEDSKVGSHQVVTEIGRPVGTAILDSNETFRLLTAEQNGARVSGPFSPKATVLDGGKATIKDAVQRSFVVAFQATPKGLKAKVRLINEGQFIHIRATIERQNRVRLEYSVQTPEILEVKTATWPGTNRKVQVPVVRTESFSGSAILTNRLNDLESLVLIPMALESSEPQKKSRFTLRRKVREKMQELLILTARISDPEKDAALTLSSLLR